MGNIITTVTLETAHLVPFTYLAKDCDDAVVAFQVRPREKRLNLFSVSYFRLFAMSMPVEVTKHEHITIAINVKALAGVLKANGDKNKGQVLIDVRNDGILLAFQSGLEINKFLPHDPELNVPRVEFLFHRLSGESASYNPIYLTDASKAWTMWDLGKTPLFKTNGELPGGFAVEKNGVYHAALVMPLYTRDIDSDMDTCALALRSSICCVEVQAFA
jgi:hypothetical protein